MINLELMVGEQAETKVDEYLSRLLSFNVSYYKKEL